MREGKRRRKGRGWGISRRERGGGIERAVCVGRGCWFIYSQGELYI